MEEFRFWLVNGLAGFLLIIVWWSVTRKLGSIDESIKTLVKNSVDTNLKLTKTTEKVVSIIEDQKQTKERLNNHAERIRSLELTQAKCKNFKTE